MDTAQHGNFYCLSRPTASLPSSSCASPPPNSKPQSRRNPLPAREIGSRILRFSAHGSLNCSLADFHSTARLACCCSSINPQSRGRRLAQGCWKLGPFRSLHRSSSQGSSSSRRIEFFLKFRVFGRPELLRPVRVRQDRGTLGSEAL